MAVHMMYKGSTHSLSVWISKWTAYLLGTARGYSTNLGSSRLESSSSSQSDPCLSGWSLPGPWSELGTPPSRHLILRKLGAEPECRPPPGAEMRNGTGPMTEGVTEGREAGPAQTPT